MALCPRLTSLWRSLAGPLIVASLILTTSPVLAADAGGDRIAAARRLYLEGKTVSARDVLERVLAGPEARDPSVRVGVLGSLLDICFRSEARACIAKHVQLYLDAVSAAPAPNELMRREQVRRTDYYLAYGRFSLGSPEVQARILDGEVWRHENAANASLYLQRQVLAADILMSLDRPVEAIGRVDRILSLVASLKNPEADRFTIARALSNAIAVLLAAGDAERAYGVYRAGHVFVARTLPPASPDGAVFRLTQARMLQQVGDVKGAVEASGAAVAAFQAMELEPDARDRVLAQALTQQAVLCAAASDMACADQAIARHPYAKLYAERGQTPRAHDEASYLAGRALVAALEGKADPVAAEALGAMAPGSADLQRTAGLAFALPPGDARGDALLAMGAQLKAGLERPSGVFGAWRRPGAVEQVLIAVALTQAGAPKADPDINFALYQLAARSGRSFDADALTALAQAKTTLERRAIHQALRLRARRDRFEREQIEAMANRALGASPDGAPLTHDPGPRLFLRAFNAQVEQAGRGASASGANLVPLRRFQALLKPNEAALSVAPGPGGLSYMCVRRDGVTYARAAVDLAKTQLDTRLLLLALTSTSAPNETSDAQFPVGAATRLYDVYVRPFEACLKPDDHILWLSDVSTLNLPLSVLLARAPPSKGAGYDLAQADWLVRRYSVSYAGSAAMVASSRSGGSRVPAAFDFLGVGDPILTARNTGRRSAELAALPPLPETREELEASAKGFRNARLLLQDKASEGGFRRELVGSYRYLSFATHGLMRDDLEALAEPALVMTPGPAGDPTDDGLLTASEIADLNLQARFVALSACNTANFDLTQVSQDLPALASAFAVAGTPATLATLWPVNSETGRRVVAATFVALQSAGSAPAEALASAQRSFLADPPGPAYRHPRFWAPFVILGDGAAPPLDAAGQGATIVAVEAVTPRGGEVIGLQRAAGGLVARYVGDADTRGRHPAGLRLGRPDGSEAWRAEAGQLGATRFMATLDGQLAAGGYAATADGRLIPTLDLYAAAGGDPRRAWRGAAVSDRDAILLGGVQLGDRAVIVVAEPEMRRATVGKPARLHLLSVDAALEPRTLADIDLPLGMSVTEATVTPLGNSLLLTYTDRAMALAARPPMSEDDYDDPLCLTEAVTRIELRDARTGLLRQMRELRGYVVIAASPRPGGVLLGGSRKAGCDGQPKAAVLSVDAKLATRAVYEDASPGVSEVRALHALPDGRTLAAGNKENVLDYRPAGPRADVYAMSDLQRTYSGMLLTLARDGTASAPTMLDSGGNVFLSAAEDEGPGRLVVGGSVGGGAALVQLTEARD
jgi:CHAT domain-containing protein